jgi:uncharacterized protein YbjQ (UPF0145 family)
MIDAKLLTTAQDLPGYRVMRSLGVVRGIIVRSSSLVGNIGASLKTVFGGSITIYTKLCDKASYDATEIADGVTEVLAYGTVVYVELFRG